MKVRIEMDIPPDHQEAEFAHLVLAQNLRVLAERITDEIITTGKVMPLRDGNGNRIGVYEVTPHGS